MSLPTTDRTGRGKPPYTCIFLSVPLVLFLALVLIKVAREVYPRICVNSALVQITKKEFARAGGGDSRVAGSNPSRLTGALADCYSSTEIDLHDHTAVFVRERVGLSGDEEQDIRVLRSWIEDHRWDLWAHVELARQLLRVGDRTGALTVYGKIHFARPLRSLGLNALASGELQQAFDYLSMARDLEPGDPDIQESWRQAQRDYAQALYREGWKARERGQIELATSYLSMALEVQPTFTDARFTLGEIQYHLGDPDAEASYLMAAETCDEPTQCALVQSRLGDLSLSSGDIQDAVLHFESALQACPECWQAMVGMGRVGLAIGDNSAAIEWALRALEVSPENEWAITILRESE